jgi:hypothetical protein
LALTSPAAAAGQPKPANAIDGVWRLKSYQGGGNEGAVSGLLILSDGHFSYVYTMNERATQQDGRAHAGRYRVDGDNLIFVVDWDLHYVGGKGIVGRNLAERKTRMALKGNTLTITFENGAAQTLERVSGAAAR